MFSLLLKELIFIYICKGSSVIDYVIVSQLLFTAVKYFEILSFEPLVSDAHSGVYLSLTCTTSIINQRDIDNAELL